ncbi:hypothetical protein Ahy_A02g008816 [Arachis hypogaea]|uniref:SWIM-type domain-containing protein n=1 Tax=Arachis hypogaea TaxID=3818 RepID=A0A445EFZ8_ARAHY|nr:hypothetical protein Ahy_A02g008816 [Arachis hypogaea]
MDDRVLLKIYHFGQILLQTSEGVKFVCENLLDIVISFIISFEELKGVICEKIDPAVARKISCILYRYPISVFGRFVQFQTRYITDEASMQEIFSVYMESCAQMPFIEFNLRPTKISNEKITRVIVKKSLKAIAKLLVKREMKFKASVTDVANALVNNHPFEEPSFMRALDLEAMHAPEFPEYMNADTIFEGNPRVRVAFLEFTGTRQNEVFEVREMPSGVEYAVDLRRHRCDCDEFQVDRIPCRHVFACCANQRLDWQVYVHDVYKIDQIRRVYRARFRPLENPTTWPAYNWPRFVPNPFLRRVAKGRPRMTRFLNEMDTRMLRGPRRCRQCGAEDHSRSRCRQAGGASAGNNSKREALHNDLYRCVRHAEPQLYYPILPKSRSKGRNFQCTPTLDLSPNNIVPNNNIIWHFTYL